MKNILIVSSPGATKIKDQSFFINPVNWNLKSYHQKKGLSKHDYHWLEPELLTTYSPFDSNLNFLLNLIDTKNISILGFSSYTWDSQHFFSLAKEIKKKYPNILIAIGGPEIDVHVNSNFFDDLQEIDCAFYGEAEIAFTRFLDYLSGYDVELVNLATKDKLYEHQIFNDKEFLRESPLSGYLDEYEIYWEKLKKKFPDKKLIAVWETVKGCPFACSFCDWQSGLHNKVRIWAKNSTKPSWQKELDLFTKLEVPEIFWTNPNLGLHKQDYEIVDYWCELAKQNLNPPKNNSPQISKINLESAIALMTKQYDLGICESFKFDIQCTNETVLANIDRPATPWPEFKKVLQKLIRDYPNLGSFRGKPKINLIWPLPGQNLDILKYSMSEIGSLGMYAEVYPWQLLPLSPAAKKEYQEKFKLKIKKGDFFESNPGIAKYVVETYSASEKEVFIGFFISQLYRSFYLAEFNVVGKEHLFFDNISKIQPLLDSSYKYWKNNNKLRIGFDNSVFTFEKFVEKLGKMFYKKIVA